MLKYIGYLLILLTISISNAQAGIIGEYVSGLKQDISTTYQDGRLSAMIPLRVWHNRLTYDKEHIDKYNEEPWGFGLGLSRYEGNDWHGLYAMAFKDSNGYAETFMGYAKIYNHTFGENRDWMWGYGYTLGITQRHEYSYIPIPLPLPLASLTYKRLALNAAYVPGVKNDGNVLFSWLRVDF